MTALRSFFKETNMEIQVLPIDFTICKLEDYSLLNPATPYCFTACTDEENSLVCPSDIVPANAIVREDGWRALRIVGTLDFSLIGILARIAQILADRGISIFALSTYNTDYILLKSQKLQAAVSALASAGYEITK